jgi:hypothetical protein
MPNVGVVWLCDHDHGRGGKWRTYPYIIKFFVRMPVVAVFGTKYIIQFNKAPAVFGERERDSPGKS